MLFHSHLITGKFLMIKLPINYFNGDSFLQGKKKKKRNRSNCFAKEIIQNKPYRTPTRQLAIKKEKKTKLMSVTFR